MTDNCLLITDKNLSLKTEGKYLWSR